MQRALVSLILLVLATSLGRADSFYLRYDADETFPEQEGWTRYWDDPDGELVRTIEDGIFRLDTRGSSAIFDLYRVISDAFDLEGGERLEVTWRMQTVETSGSYGRSDVIVLIVNKDHAYAEFFLGRDFVSEDEELGGEPEHFYNVDPGVPHVLEFVTDDMSDYELFVDGDFAFRGLFHGYAWHAVPRVSFGDAMIGRTSLSEWDYVEVAVVPEASSSVLGAALVTVAWGYRRIRQ